MPEVVESPQVEQDNPLAQARQHRIQALAERQNIASIRAKLRIRSRELEGEIIGVENALSDKLVEFYNSKPNHSGITDNFKLLDKLNLEQLHLDLSCRLTEVALDKINRRCTVLDGEVLLNLSQQIMEVAHRHEASRDGLLQELAALEATGFEIHLDNGNSAKVLHLAKELGVAANELIQSANKILIGGQIFPYSSGVLESWEYKIKSTLELEDKESN